MSYARCSGCRRGGQAGFTLVETLVALAILISVAAGVAGLVSVAARAAQAARRQTSGTWLAMQKMEQLKSLTWSFAGDADASPRASDTITDLSLDPPATGGRGLGPAPAATLDRNTPGYVEYLDGTGRWVGTGTEPPPTAVFIRRWSVEPLPVDPEDTLVLQVLVTSVVTERAVRLAPAELRRPLAGDALLTTMIARRQP